MAANKLFNLGIRGRAL